MRAVFDIVKKTGGSMILCIVCEAPGDHDRRNPVCPNCTAVHDHIVSMQIDQSTGEHLAICPCGWRHRSPRGSAGFAEREAAVNAHWRDVVGLPA